MVAIRILGRGALVALFIFALVAVAMAQDNSDQTPAIVVDDQISTNNTVTVRQVTAPQAAFLVIQRDLTGVPGPVIGQVAVPVGMTENVSVPLTEAVAPGNVLYAALYVDAGQLGVFEVPGADAPFVLNNQALAQPFTVTAASSDQLAQLTPAVTLSPTGAVSPTVTVSPTITVSPTVSLPLSATATTQAVPPVQPTPLVLPAPFTPTLQPTPQQPVVPAPPTATVDIQATANAPAQEVQPQEQAPPTATATTEPRALPPTPSTIPVTGASGAAHLPATLLIGALAFVLVTGGCTLLQRRRRS